MASVDSPRTAEGRRLALVIANGEYERDSGLATLQGPAVDARRLSAVLEDPAIGDFTVDAVIDRPSAEVKSKLDTFLTAARPRDLVVVYLSCHGVIGKHDQTLYFAALDTYRTSLRTTATQARWVTELLDECRALRKILILDCCYSGAFARGAKGGGIDVGADLIGSGQGLVVLTSSRAVQESYEDEGEDGAFTSVFTAGLVDGMRTGEADRDRDGWISLDEAYHYAREYVQARRPEQNPQRWMVEAEGAIYLARSAHSASMTSSVPAGVSARGIRGETPGAHSRPASPAPPGPALSIRLLRELAGHRGHVYDAAFSPNGALLATVGGDATARLWDCATGDLRNTVMPSGVRSPLTPLRAVAVSPDGSQFTAGGVSTDVYVWRTNDGGSAGYLTGATATISALAYSPDGTLLAAACEDGTVRLWTPGTGRMVLTMDNGVGTASAIAFSADGRMLAAAGDGDVRLWDPADGKLLKQLGTESDETLGLAFSPAAEQRDDAAALFVGGRGIVEVWDPTTARRVGELAAPTPSLVLSVRLSSNGQLVAGAGEQGELWLWDVPSGELLATQHAHTRDASAVAFHPNGRMLCSVGADERVCLWKLSAGSG